MSGIVLGIDLGTTNSVVALADGEKTQVLADTSGRRLIPSVVSFHPDGQILVGDHARDRRLIDAKHTIYSVKRLIGRPFTSPEVRRAQERLAFDLVESPNGGVQVSVRGEGYTLTEISAYVLREVRKVAEQVIGQPCRRAVITVPANFNELQRSATKAAGRVAGLDVLRIINEPTAAALAYGLGREGSQKVAVYDLGGGTFDITILEMDGQVFEVVSTAGDSFLGGDDCDLVVAEAMADACLEQHRWDPRVDAQAFERLRAAAEWVKCALSDRPQVNITIEELTYGPGGEAIDLTYGLSQADLVPILQPLIARTFDVVNDALSGAAMNAKDLDSVILVCGSTRMPLVRSMVSEFFGQPSEISIDPDLVVAQGAAIHGFALAGEKTRKALGRIKLKKATAGQVAEAKRLRAESAETRPKQPAFAPPRAPATPPPVPPPVNRPSPPSADRISLTDLSEPGALATSSSSSDLTEELSAALNDLSLELDDLGGATEIHDLPSDTPTLPGPDQSPPSPPPSAPVDLSPSGLVPLELDLAGSSPTIGAFTSGPEIGVLPMASVDAPLLMDVTSHSFGIETAGGYCQHLIRRNAPIPAEQTRIFTTAHDNQQRVVARVCQGESRSFEENEVLGEVELADLRASARGELKIEVCFLLNASGTLDVTARDTETGQAQTIQINLRGGLSEDEISAMESRQQSHFV